MPRKQPARATKANPKASKATTAVKTRSSAVPVSKPKTQLKPNAKTTRTKAAPKTKTKTETTTKNKTANKPKPKTKTAPKTKSKAKAEAGPKPRARAPRAPRPPKPITGPTVHDALFVTGSNLDSVAGKFHLTALTPATRWRETPQRTARLAASVPGGRLRVEDGREDFHDLARSLKARLVGPCPLPGYANTVGDRRVRDLARAASAILDSSAFGAPPSGAWRDIALPDCPVFTAASESPGAGVLQVGSQALDALLALEDMDVRAPQRRGGGAQIGLQLFHAMHVRSWTHALVTDGKAFVLVVRAGATLRVTDSNSVVAPRRLTLLGALTELLFERPAPQDHGLWDSESPRSNPWERWDPEYDHESPGFIPDDIYWDRAEVGGDHAPGDDTHDYQEHYECDCDHGFAFGGDDDGWEAFYMDYYSL